MIIWRGKGGLVALITFVCALVTNAAVDQFGGKGYWDVHRWTFGLALILRALLVFVLSRMIDTSERVLLDERTGNVCWSPLSTICFGYLSNGGPLYWG